MALVNLSELLEKASLENYAVGAFNVANMEMIIGVIKAAEEKMSPAVLQIAQVRLPYSPLALIGPMMIAAAKQASVPIAVHFDHGRDIDIIKQALDLGFTSVMIDASELSIKQNIEIVQNVKRLSDTYGADVEAEAGMLSGNEGEGEDLKAHYSDPLEVKLLYEHTGVDAIAVSIGNAHGLYKSKPKLDYDILRQIAGHVKVPLVLHGGSGISDNEFKQCINYGIKKINIATANFRAVEQAAREYAKNDEKDYFKLSNIMVEAVYETVARHIDVFGSAYKAKYQC